MKSRLQVATAGAAGFALALCVVTCVGWVPLATAQQAPATQEASGHPAQITDAGTVPQAETADPSAESAPESLLPRLMDNRFWLSGQANFIFQTNPPFFAKYSGPHSLDSHYEKATSRVLTFYTGVRLGGSMEILVDIEETGGAALSTGLGLAGFTDLDIVRNPLLSKAPYVARALIHKVFALSKDKIENERNPLSLFGELPKRRLEVRFGKFGMVDFFDQNSAGS